MVKKEREYTYNKVGINFCSSGKKRKRNVVTEAYPESEFNPSSDVLSGNGKISIQDLLDPLRGTSSYSKLRKRIEHVEKKGETVQAPLSKPDRERLERGVAYDHVKKDITKWEHLVKRNREAPTLYFDQGNDMGLPTVGTMASEFKPRSDFEKAIASIMDNKEVAEAYQSDGAKLLELNKVGAVSIALAVMYVLFLVSLFRLYTSGKEAKSKVIS